MDACLTESELMLARDTKLSPREQSRVDDHLKSCASCRERLQRLTVRQQPGDKKLSRDFFAHTLRSDAAVAPARMVIEGYDVLSEIHRGGQGVVYKAVQRSTRRTVALKVLPHEDIASMRQKQRFEREVSLAANLRHPNIVTVYDSGLTSGRYFFAMEHIHGKPLDEYLSYASPDLQEKLRIFAVIASAIAYAHQQGVIHRDLKPGNILVDSLGEPHVVDFGLAKTAGPQLSEGLPVTLTSQFMGTLAYASPEQTKGDPALVDARSDIYSLGVILFEMLTGRYPYPMPGDLVGAFKSICEHEPAKPSSLSRELDSDLDTIVLRALAKDPIRRYQTVGDLSEDVERYLAGEPIAARRDSMVYLMQVKSRAALRRHPALTMLAVAALAALLASNLTPWLSRLWPWPARWYEQVAAGGLIGGPLQPGAFENVRIIGITDQTEARLDEVAAQAGVEGVTAANWKSLRRLHGRLMDRLAEAGVGAVVWDLTFNEDTPFDADFAGGVHALRDAGAGVAVAMQDWIVNPAGEPVMSAEILRSRVLWGGVTMDIDEHSVWKMDVVVQHPGQPPMCSIALAGLGAWRHPGMNMGLRIDLAAERLELQYSDPDTPVMQAVRQVELVPLSSVRQPRGSEDAEFGLTADSFVGLYAVRLPTPQVLAGVTRGYHDVLLSDDADLKAWCAGRLVLIGDQRPTGGDLHVVPGHPPVFGSLVQAATIDSLISNALPARYPRRWAYAASIAVGGIMGALAAYRFHRRRMASVGLGVALIAAIIGLCILAFHFTAYLWQPHGPVLALALAFSMWLWFDPLYSHPRTEAHSIGRTAS